MSASLLTLDGLRARFGRCPDCLVDFADELAARFATFGEGGTPAPLAESARQLLACHPKPSELPLWGAPYVVGVNVDVLGLPTSIGIPALDFEPDFNADLIERLQAAGALLVGKVPVDALGFDAPAAGAAASVAAGMAAFGIVSGQGAAAAAARHGVVAIEPTPGIVPAEGLFAVAPELDGMAIFAADVTSGTSVRCVLERAAGSDEEPPRPPLSLGVIENGGSATARERAEGVGLTVVSVEASLFAELAALMDDDIWLALRLDDVAPVFAELPELFPIELRGRLARAFAGPASAQIRAQRHLSDLRRRVEASFSRFDLLFVPPDANLGGFISACGLAAVILPDGGALVGPGGRDAQLSALAPAFMTPNPTAFTRPIDILALSPLAHR